ncbi:MAG: HEPN domain-containing protein [Candidatus Methylomirabilales bacterium]
MRNDRIALELLRDAGLYLSEAKTYLAKGEYHIAIRRSQECCELALKALLRFLGIEYPKVHDVGMVVDQALAEKLKTDLSIRTRIKEISRRLAEEREPAFYGSAGGEAPRGLFTADTAKHGVSDAQYVYDFVRATLPCPPPP